ncbi:MAG: isoprenylcysteine carboxylmethyltransferase family protein [Silvibacterium sp.]
MGPFIERWVGVIWLVFGIVWMVAAMISKRSVQRQTYGSRILQSGLIFIIMLFIFNFWNFFARGWLTTRLIPETPFWVLFGAVMAVTGVLLCFWARTILGSNWSGMVTIKQNHELILRGPYAIVRHPIYTGLLTGMLGTAIIYGLARCFMGVFVCGVALWLKLRIEERFMAQQFGQQYAQYRQRTRALVPFLL